MHKRIQVTGLALALSLAFGAGAGAADLPKATQDALKKLKLDAKVLDGLDAELNVPKAWVDGAAKEGEVVILGTWSNKLFPKMTAPFRERYPGVKLNYNRARTSGRGMKVLIALKEGQVVTDITTAVADAYFEFMKMNALADLRELPGYKNVEKDFRADDGTWAAHKLSFRCMAYNTEKVKKADLPKSWGDLLSDPRWRNGNLALSNHPNSWMLPLWGAFGEKRGSEFMRDLFAKVKPQLRKEGMTATTSLTVAGEFHANIPAPEWRVKGWVEKGAPVAYHCPEPVPMTLSQIVMLEKAKHKNGARLFIYWILSREGQLLQYVDSYTVPVHMALQSERFVPFSDTVAGKKRSIRDDALLGSDMHKRMIEQWKNQWEGVRAGK